MTSKNKRECPKCGKTYNCSYPYTEKGTQEDGHANISPYDGMCVDVKYHDEHNAEMTVYLHKEYDHEAEAE